MATKTKMRLGTPTDLKCTNEVIQKHKQVKTNVVKVLKDLAEQSEGLVIEQIEDEISETVLRSSGRGIVIVSGFTSILLLSNPIGAAVGVSGIIVGYTLYNG